MAWTQRCAWLAYLWIGLCSTPNTFKYNLLCPFMLLWWDKNIQSKAYYNNAKFSIICDFCNFFENITPLFKIIIVLLQVYLPIYIYSMAKKDVNRLKIMLAVTKHSNKWLAEMLGKDQATISKWCTNTCQPDLETLIRISDLLKEVVYLIYYVNICYENCNRNKNWKSYNFFYIKISLLFCSY